MDLDDFLALTALSELQKERTTNLANENRLREENSQIKEKASNAEAVLRIKQGFTQGELEKAKSLMEAHKQRSIESASKLVKLQQEVRFYEELLKHDVETIALNIPDFEKTLNSEYDLLARWMISQKGFKETAIRFGQKLGFSEDDVNRVATKASLEIADTLVEKANPENKFDIYEKSRIERAKKMICK